MFTSFIATITLWIKSVLNIHFDLIILPYQRKQKLYQKFKFNLIENIAAKAVYSYDPPLRRILVEACLVTPHSKVVFSDGPSKQSEMSKNI